MGGKISKVDAVEKICRRKKAAGAVNPTVNVNDLMNFLQEEKASEKHKFTYVGCIANEKSEERKKKSKDSECDDSSILHILDLLPLGVFAGWG
jgi:hypothetical protein